MTETLLKAPETLLGVQNQAYHVVHGAKQTHLLFYITVFIRLSAEPRISTHLE